MRKFKVLSTSLVAAFSFGFAACGDDPEPATDTKADATETTPETTPDATEEAEVAAEVTPDAEVADPCTPNPCTAKAPICNAEGAVVSYGAGACDAGECTYPETTAACDAGAVCAGGTCVTAGDACDYTFDKRISYVTSIEVAGADCCFDLGGANANVDNALGALLQTIGGLVPGFDVNEILVEQIASGGLVLLLETKNVTDVSNSSGVILNGFYGEDGDTDPTNNASGTASFLVSESSFVEGTTQPLISFPGSAIASGVLSAGPSVFRLSIPLLGTILDLAVDGTRLESPVSAGADGADGGLAFGGESGGKLGGYVNLQSLADAFNTYLDTSCECITKKDDSKPYLGVTQSGDKFSITSNINKYDACESGSTCASIGQYVPLAGNFITPDIDGDEDGIKESISVGVRIKATSAKVLGVTDCP